MTPYLLSIDPGVSTGVALLAYEDNSAPELVQAWQFTGGMTGLLAWIQTMWREAGWDDYWDAPRYAGLRGDGIDVPDELSTEWMTQTNPEFDADDAGSPYELEVPPNLIVVAEKFTARATSGFSYTTSSLEPLRCEGALIAKGLMPDYKASEKRWRDPGLQYLVGGKDKADKKKRVHAFLKDIGFYRTGKDFGTPDADDARSAMAHGIAYLARELHHKTSYDLMTNWASTKGVQTR